MPLDQCEARCDLAEDRRLRTRENLPCQIFHGRECRHDDLFGAHLVEERRINGIDFGERRAFGSRWSANLLESVSVNG